MNQYQPYNEDMLITAIQYKGRETNDALYRNFGERINISGRLSDVAYIRLDATDRISHKLTIGKYVIKTENGDLIVLDERSFKLLFKEYIY